MVTVVDTDRYGRLVGTVKRGDTDVTRRLVTDGLAWHHTTSDKTGEYTDAESDARTATRGRLADPSPTTPWEF